MNRSLSVLLPVHNAQRTLERDVAEILDIVPELVSKFELLIIDDGSADSTWDVAENLSRRYPQVKVLRQPMRQGPAVAIHAGARRTQGDIVIAHDGQPGIDAGEIASLLRDHTQIVAPPIQSPRSVLPRSVLTHGTATSPAYGRTAANIPAAMLGVELRAKHSGFRLLRIGTVEELRRSVAAVNRLQWGGQPASELKQPQPAALPAPALSAPALFASATPAPTRQTSAAHALSRPNFLSRIRQSVKDFTLGE